MCKPPEVSYFSLFTLVVLLFIVELILYIVLFLVLWLTVASSHSCGQRAGSSVIFDGYMVCSGTFYWCGVLFEVCFGFCCLFLIGRIRSVLH